MKGRIARGVVISVLAFGMLAATLGTASASVGAGGPGGTGGTRTLDIFATRHGIFSVHLNTWTRGYQWVRFLTRTGAGITGPEPVSAVVHIRCGGWRKRVRWFDGDGSSSRVVFIRPNQGRCYESYSAWTDDGARIWIGVGVHER